MFQQGNKLAVGGRKDKPFREALLMELKAAGEDHKALRRIARAIIEKASDGDIQAIKEIADRMDGKVPQGVIGGEDDDPSIKVDAAVTMTIVDPRSS